MFESVSHRNAFIHLCSLMSSLLPFRPGSASPSGKPSGPGAPTAVVSLPGHYTQQVFSAASRCFSKPHGTCGRPVCALLQVSAPQGSMVMHMRPPTSGPFPNPIQRPVMQVNKVIIRSPQYPGPGREPPPSNPEPAGKGPEDGMKVSHPL